MKNPSAWGDAGATGLNGLRITNAGRYTFLGNFQTILLGALDDIPNVAVLDDDAPQAPCGGIGWGCCATPHAQVRFRA